MNILTHPVHTGYQYDLSRTGHEFYSLDIPESGEIFWDARSRPQPPNFHRLKSIQDAPVKFDLALAHYDLGYYRLRSLDIPMIFKEHCLRQPFAPPVEWTRRVTYFCFSSQAAAARWQLPPELDSRKTIIGMGIDTRLYSRHDGRIPRVLVVAQNLPGRGAEKGCGNVLRLADKLPFTIVGHGSERMPSGVGAAPDFDALRRYYRSHRVFLNPGPSLGMSTLEAMATGMPVVTFRPVNSDIVRDGENGYVVDSVREAERTLRAILGNARLARRLGVHARETIRERFAFGNFVERWNSLIKSAVYEHRPGLKFKVWQPFHLSNKRGVEAEAARELTRLVFKYHRVGYDQRTMTFLPDGSIGKGAAGCERYWDLKLDKKEGLVLEISSGWELTCRLHRNEAGTWSGRWLHHEQMPVRLSPI
jgi:glycosyltransferase involved in cell wall biosynthesis